MQTLMKTSRWRRGLRDRVLQSSKWFLWLTCSAAVVWVGWALYQSARKPVVYDSASADGKGAGHVESGIKPKAAQPTAAPSDRIAWVRTAVRDFPADPDLWPVAAREFLAEDPKAASRILLAAAEGRNDTAEIHGDAAVACLLAGDSVRASRELEALSDRRPADWRIAMAAQASAAVAGPADTGRPDSGVATADPPGGPQEAGDRERGEFIQAGARFLRSACVADANAAQPLIDMARVPNAWQLESERLLAEWLPNPHEAVAWAQLAAESGGTPQDWIRYAALLARSGGDPAPAEAKAALVCRASADSARDFAGWMMVEGRQVEALAWIKGLDAAVASEPAIRERQATIDCRLGKMDPLRADLLAGAWGRAKPEATEFAFGALLAARRDEAALAAQMWTQALEVARSDPETMALLLRLAETSGLRAETAASFDAMISAPQAAENGPSAGPDPLARRRDAAWRFFSWARLQGDDELTQRAARSWLDADPSNENAQLAWSRMVLSRGDAANLAAAVAQVEGLCHKRSEFLPLLAFARHVEGRDADAILILSKIPAAQLSPDEREWVQSVASRMANVFESAPQ